MEIGFRNFIFEIVVKDFQDLISEIASDTPTLAFSPFHKAYASNGRKDEMYVIFYYLGQDTDAAVARSSASRTTVLCSGVHCIYIKLRIQFQSQD